jgi:hypothetical protein
MAVSEFREQVEQIGIGFDAIQFAGADQGRGARPVAPALVMTGEECIATIHGRAANGVFDQVRVHVDMTVVQKEAKAILTFQDIGHGFSEFGFARHAGGLCFQPFEEGIDQRPGALLPGSTTDFRTLAADFALDLVECSDPHQRLVHDRRARLGFGLDQLSATMAPAECQFQRLATGSVWLGQAVIAAIGIHCPAGDCGQSPSIRVGQARVSVHFRPSRSNAIAMTMSLRMTAVIASFLHFPLAISA